MNQSAIIETVDSFIPSEGFGSKVIVAAIVLAAGLLLASAVFNKLSGKFQYKVKLAFVVVGLEFALYVFVRSMLKNLGSEFKIEGISKWMFFFFYDKVLRITPEMERSTAIEIGVPILLSVAVLFIFFLKLLSFKSDDKKMLPIFALIFTLATLAGGVGLWKFLGLFEIMGIKFNHLFAVITILYLAVVFLIGNKKRGD